MAPTGGEALSRFSPVEEKSSPVLITRRYSDRATRASDRAVSNRSLDALAALRGFPEPPQVRSWSRSQTAGAHTGSG
jgi:hypothetical protein